MFFAHPIEHQLKDRVIRALPQLLLCASGRGRRKFHRQATTSFNTSSIPDGVHRPARRHILKEFGIGSIAATHLLTATRVFWGERHFWGERPILQFSPVSYWPTSLVGPLC